MPMPTPSKDEEKKDYLRRCMGDETMRKDFPDIDQRYAVCNTQWDDDKKKKDKDGDADHK